MLAWILEVSGLAPGFLIGGIAENFGLSARSGDSDYFVVEADEYDTAFFDKRSKFIHYHPRTLVIGNIEFDHADIFADIGAIRREFHHLVRTMASQGQIIIRQDDVQIEQVIGMGCWTPVVSFGVGRGQWQAQPLRNDFSSFQVIHAGAIIATVDWQLIGSHNAENALAAIVAAVHVGVAAETACAALGRFKSVKRRLQRLACVSGISVYDDFAHHPTAIRLTLEALRLKVGDQRIIAIMEPRSNTMKMGIHRDTLAQSLREADLVVLYQAANLTWDLGVIKQELGENSRIFTNIEDIITFYLSQRQAGDHVVIMSNGGFENIHQRLIARLMP